MNCSSEDCNSIDSLTRIDDFIGTERYLCGRCYRMLTCIKGNYEETIEIYNYANVDKEEIEEIIKELEYIKYFISCIREQTEEEKRI